MQIFFRCSGAILLLLISCWSVQSVNAQIVGDPDPDPSTAFATFKCSEYYSDHNDAGASSDYPALNGRGVIATGLDGLAFRKPVLTEIYKRDKKTGKLVPTLYVELLNEISVRDAAEKMVLDPGERVTIDFTVTLLDSRWAPKEDYCEWNWEDNEEPIIKPLPFPYPVPGSSINDWHREHVFHPGFKKISYNVEYCDFEIRHFQGIGYAPPFYNSIPLLALPCASYKGTLEVEFDGGYGGEPFIEFHSSPVQAAGTSNVSLNWDFRSTFANFAATFYEDSAFDVDDDDDAIAPDKVPLFDGQTAKFENYTSYDKGVNGIVIDVMNLFHDTGQVTAEDFVFKTGNDNTPDDWKIAPDPVEVINKPGGGINGSDRVYIIWGDDAIKKSWLQVHMPETETEKQDGCGLKFYFGNLPGETGAGDNSVNVFDLLSFRKDYGKVADLLATADFNRDGVVNVFDLLIFRQNYGTTPAPLITPQSSCTGNKNSKASGTKGTPNFGNLTSK